MYLDSTFPSGKIIELMRERNVPEAFKALIPHLHYNKEARSLFCQLLRCKEDVFLLGDYLEAVRDNAEKGNPWMQYAWARINDCLALEADSVEIAQEYYSKASEAGIPDARMCLAYMWRDGDFGMVDMEKYVRERNLAIDEGSHMAVQQNIRDIIYGQAGYKADPVKAISMLSNYLQQSSGSYIDPRYYTLMGNAVKEAGKDGDAVEWYEKALSEGDRSALFLLVADECFDENGKLIDKDKYEELMLRGRELMCPESFLDLQLYIDEDLYDGCEDEFKRQITESLENDLQIATRLGENLGAYYLGCNYYYGSFGFEQDFEKAAKWFSLGAIRRCNLCYSMLAQMIEEGNHPSSCDPDKQHEFEIRALRLGSSDMLNKVVDAYKHGFLTAYAAEIEKYYIPLVESQETLGNDGSAEDPDGNDCLNGDDGLDDNDGSADAPHEGDGLDGDDYPDDDGRFDAWS